MLIEGLALSKLLVAASIGGPLEIVMPECGRLSLRVDAGLRERLDIAARERADEFTVQRTADRMVATYGELLVVDVILAK